MDCFAALAMTEQSNVTQKDLHYYEPAKGHGLKHDPFNAIIAPLGDQEQHHKQLYLHLRSSLVKWIGGDSTSHTNVCQRGPPEQPSIRVGAGRTPALGTGRAGNGPGVPGKVVGAEEKPKQPLVEVVSPTSSKPVIMTVAEIKAMSPELAKQELPVSIRGVLTAVLPEIHGAVLQDSTSGIFVYLDDPKRFAVLLQRGEFYQFDGVTGPGLFAPVIVPRAITHLGAGQWPQPQHATWAHLVNGSLDNPADQQGI